MGSMRMMIQMTIYKKPNYGKAQEKAYETLIRSQISTLPVNLKKIIKSIKGLHLIKYTVFAKEEGMTLKEVCDLVESEEGCLWKRSDGEFIILYNNTITKKERIRFTIAHEIGHYVLDHLG